MSTFPRLTKSGYCVSCGGPGYFGDHLKCPSREGRRIKFQRSRRALRDARNNSAFRAKEANDRRLMANL